MDRQEDSQAYVRIVATLLALAAMASAAGALPARDHIVLLAVLRHAAVVACAFAARIHAPHFHAQLDRRLWPALEPGESEAVGLAEIFRALAVALAFPARAAIRASRWQVHQPSACPANARPPASRRAPALPKNHALSTHPERRTKRISKDEVK